MGHGSPLPPWSSVREAPATPTRAGDTRSRHDRGARVAQRAWMNVAPRVLTTARSTLAAKPTEADLPRVAGAAALFAAVPSALVTLAQQGGVRAYVPVLALIVLVTLGVFAWGVPAALDLDEQGPSVVALGLAGLALLTVPLFWTGLPALLGAGAIALGRMCDDEPESQRLAQAATRVGAASIVLYLLLVVVDVLG